MITVQVTRNHAQYSLHVQGHAEFDNYGSDIICAGVSSIVFGGINALGQYLDSSEWFQIKGNTIRIMIDKCNHEIDIILETILWQLKTMEDSFPENIKIQEV